MNPADSNSQDTLLDMYEDRWITYLTSNRMLDGTAHALLQNKYMRMAFGESIATYRRDDFTSDQLPAVSIYEPEDIVTSRFFPYTGKIYFDIYLPLRLERKGTSAVFNTLGKEFKNVIQSQPFWFDLIDYLVPLPATSSSIYEEVKRYKERHGSPLVNFAQNCQIINPNKAKIDYIGDVWKLQIIADYQFDMSNYYAMLEDFGINADVDPNKIVYEILAGVVIQEELVHDNEVYPINPN